jgi:hypothetical protein
MAVTLLLAWGQEWLRELSLPVASTAIRNEDLAQFLTKELPLALFSTAELSPGKLPARATDLAYLQAALDGGWPSEPCEPSRTVECEPDPFSLPLDKPGL